jgi:hypothetical protein
MRVRVGSTYIYNANGFDRFYPTSNNSLQEGQIVKVINIPSAPKANTMGQCYVADVHTGKFLCMVSTSSLTPVSDVIRKLKAQVAAMDAA